MNSFDLTADALDPRLDREWLAVNHLGGYASSTVTGLNNRKYHGLLVAAMSPPVRRMVLLSRVEETVVCDGWNSPLSCSEYPGTIHPRGDQSLRAFNADPFPRWAYQGDGWTVEKSLRLVRGSNTVVLSYTLLGGDKPIELHLHPMLALRSIHEVMYQSNSPRVVETRADGTHRVAATATTPEVFFAHDGVFEREPLWYLNNIYRRETERGYSGLEDLWAPGVVRWSLEPGRSAQFVCSADPIDFAAVIQSVEESSASETLAPILTDSPDAAALALHRAADQFILFVPPNGHERAEHCNQCTYVAADYPWSPPSPRQSLIAFEALFLSPKNSSVGLVDHREAATGLLASLAERVVDGLIPSSFNEIDGRPRYEGADVSLWYVNAVGALLRTADIDPFAARRLWATVRKIIDSYRAGTRLGISVDADGLLSAGTMAIAVTWMNGIVDGRPVTPRGGKAVELNALWYNALRIGVELARMFDVPELASEWMALGRRAQRAFNERFWNDAAGCCYDVIDVAGASVTDASIRPNQLLAAGLTYPVLSEDRFGQLLETARSQLLTPVGLRTLCPTDRRYTGTFRGNVMMRDRARHNGCVFPWLLGPYLQLHLRVHGNDDRARRAAAQLLNGCEQHLLGAGLGQLPEMFEGNAPHNPGGAIGSAASVGQVLTALNELNRNSCPPPAAFAPGEIVKSSHAI